MSREPIPRADGRRLFGSDPETYERARPGHAERVYELLVERCGLCPGTSVLEVGPGTGQATRRLLELGADPLVAVEPDPELASYLRGKLGDRVDVRVLALEDAELEPGSFDLAAAASSFHWVEEKQGLATLHSALRAGGSLALWWTLFGDEERPDAFLETIDPLFEQVPRSPSAGRDGGPSFALDEGERLAALARAGFSTVEHEVIRWSASWDAAGLRALYATFSPILKLPDGQREELLAAVERVAAHDFGGRVEKHLLTSVYTARRPA